MSPLNDSRSSSSLYQTDLAQTPLPEILVTIHRYKAPGVVECRRGDEVKRIYLDRGHIIFASSNRLTDSLGDKLLRDGRINQEQYDESIRRHKITGKRHGVTLVEMRLLQPQELFTAVSEQIQDIVWAVFAWGRGTVAFTPGREKHLEFVKIEVSIPQAILRGVRRMPEPRALVARLGTKSTVLERTGHEPDGLTLNAEEENLLQSVNGSRILYELVNTPPLPPSENARILYSFFALQLIAAKQTRHIKVQLRTDSDRSPQ